MSASEWTQANVTDDDPGHRVDVDAEGMAHVRFFSEKFRHEDEIGVYGYLGVGCQVIE